MKINNEEEFIRCKKLLQEINIKINKDGPYLHTLQIRNKCEKALSEYDVISKTNRKGNWMSLYSGHRFWPLDPRPEEVFIEDIARGLANICRYYGHVKDFLSVAQHSIYAALLAPPEHKIAALFHDASEAYCGDVISMVKVAMPGYREVEAAIMDAIARRFNFDIKYSEAVVKEIDRRLLATEVRDVVPMELVDCEIAREPYDFKIIGWQPDLAFKLFLQTYENLTCQNKPTNLSMGVGLFAPLSI